MRAGHVWLASFLFYPLVGAPLLSARTFRVFGLPTRAVLSGGVGMVLVSWTMTLFALPGLRWGPLVLLVAAAFSAALRLLMLTRGDAVAAPAPPDGRPGAGRAIVPIARGITAVSVFAALAATLAGGSTSADLVLFWGPKAQQFAIARTIDAGFLGSPFLEYLHVYYPPLVPNVFALGAMAAGRFPWGAATLTFPLLLAATAIGLAGILKTGSGPLPAAAVTALVTCGIALVGIRALVPGNAEPFLLFFEILAVALLLTPAAASTGGKLLAGIFLAGAATSKVEGFPFVLAATLLFALVERENLRRTLRSTALLLGPTVLSLGAWLAFGEVHRLFHGYRGYGEVLAPRWDRLPGIMATIGADLWKSGYALPWLVPLAVLLLSGRTGRRVLLPIGIAVLLAGFLVFTYLTTAGDPTMLIHWSAARVFSPISGLFALAVLASPGPRRGSRAPSPG
jgi:hypothetical protein